MVKFKRLTATPAQYSTINTVKAVTGGSLVHNRLRERSKCHSQWVVVRSVLVAP